MTDTQDAVERYGDAVYRLAYSYTRSRQDADDVFQDTFLRYHRAETEFQSESHRRAWLLKTAANCAKSLFLSPWRKRMVPLEDVYAYETPEASAVDEALSQLPGKYRAVIHLYYYEGYSTGEIAYILQRKPATVRAQLTRARQRLSELLKEEV